MLPFVPSTVAFGMVARQTGLRIAEAAAMSGLVFAGSSQFAALGLWSWPIPGWPSW
ncbi:MAG: AzlC family ABC transporter permease [Chloroflexota bacterium]